jgi:ketosteroid isomerase-like protein
MSMIQKYLVCFGAGFMVLLMVCAVPAKPGGGGQAEIVAFNAKYSEATRRMDNAATMALFTEDAVDLLPGMEPMSGKVTITKWLDQTMEGLKGIQMVSNEDEFHDIEVSGNWASEWANTHQVVNLADGKRVEIYGKMLLVLQKGGDGQWKIKEEMWNNIEKH